MASLKDTGNLKHRGTEDTEFSAGRLCELRASVFQIIFVAVVLAFASPQ